MRNNTKVYTILARFLVHYVYQLQLSFGLSVIAQQTYHIYLTIIPHLQNNYTLYTWSGERQKLVRHFLVNHEWNKIEVLDFWKMFVNHAAAVFTDEVVEHSLVPISVLLCPVKPQNHNLLVLSDSQR